MPRDRNTLALTAGERHAALADAGVEAIGEPVDDLVRPGRLGRAPHLGVGGLRPADPNVLGHRLIEEIDVLEDKGQLIQHDDGPLVRLFIEIWAIAAAEPTIRDVVTTFYAEYTHQVAEFIRHHQPESDPATARARAETFVALMEGATLMRSGIAAHRSPATDDIIRTAAVTLLTGTSATPR